MMNNGEGRDGRKGEGSKRREEKRPHFQSNPSCVIVKCLVLVLPPFLLPSSFHVIVIGHREGSRVPVLDCLFRIFR